MNPDSPFQKLEGNNRIRTRTRRGFQLLLELLLFLHRPPLRGEGGSYEESYRN